MTATSETPLTFEDALSVLQDLLERHKAKHGTVPDAVVVLGGTALGAHRIRATSLDVDVYMTDVDDDLVSQTWKAGVAKFGPKFRLDATATNNAWGPMAIRDIEQSPEAGHLFIGVTRVAVRAISPETIFVLKCEVRRPKDQDDLGPIAAAVGPDRLIARFNQMLRPSWLGDRSRAHLLAAFFRDSVARHCGLEPQDVEARLALPDVIKERVRELDAANAKKTALLLTAGFRRAADTIRQTVVHGQTRFQIDVTRLAPEVQRLAQEQPDVAQQVMRSIVGGSQAGGQTISPATPPTAPLDASQIPSVEPLRLEMTLSSAAQRAAVNRIPEQERPARYAATLAAFQEAERRIAAGDKSPAAARERGELRTGRDALAAVLRDTTKTVRQPEAAPAKPRAKSRDQGQER